MSSAAINLTESFTRAVITKLKEEIFTMNEFNREDIFANLEYDVQNSDMPETLKNKMLTNILHLREQKINIMITGATGSGKSSTINAMFNADVAKVGVGVDPETMSIEKYTLHNLVLWDSPGLGDGKEADNRHARNIINKLAECDSSGKALIDLVLVILDGSTRDLGTSYELINQIIIPNLGPNKSDRILVAINQCDVAMKGKHWDHERNMPDNVLKEFLDEKVQSVRRRIKEGTGVDVEPIYYSAGYKESEYDKQNPYNLSKLLYYIIQHTPKEKRLVYIDNVPNNKPELWRDNDDLKDYSNEIKKTWAATVIEHVTSGVETGVEIGKSIGGMFGKTGEMIGGALGGFVGAVGGFISGAISTIGSWFGF